MEDRERLEALADFLRTRRARLAPGDVGLPAGGRRRTAGLRREEVAMLANIGTSWYTALEQGREVRPSDQVLRSVADALQFTDAERRHLFLLAQPHPADDRTSEAAASKEPISDALENTVRALDPHPAYVLGRRWDLLAWNRAAELVFSFSAIRPPHTRNFLWRSFTDPVLLSHPNMEKLARSIVAQFRADSARYPGDPAFAELIEDLMHASELFRELWPRHDVKSLPDGVKRMEHPLLGKLEFHHTTLLVPARPEQKVVLYTCTAKTAECLTGLLS